MEEKRMIKVTVDGAEYDYPHGTPYRTIAADFQDRYPWDILLVNLRAPQSSGSGLLAENGHCPGPARHSDL